MIKFYFLIFNLFILKIKIKVKHLRNTKQMLHARKIKYFGIMRPDKDDEKMLYKKAIENNVIFCSLVS